MKHQLLFLFAAVWFTVFNASAQWQKVHQSDPDPEDSFGWSVSVDGDRMVIGNVYDDDLDIQSGSAFVYNWNGSSWVEEAKLLPSDGGFAEYFGYDVEIHGSTIIVGAYRGLHQGEQCGKAYIFEKFGGTWVQTAILAPFNGLWDDRFGTCVDIFEDHAVVCAWGDDEAALDAGAAFVYKKDAGIWVLDSKLMPPNLAENDHFGLSAAMDNENILVAAAESDGYPQNSGLVYHYETESGIWTYQGFIVPDDSQEESFFGRDVSVYDNTLVVGAYHDDIYGENSGSAYIFNYDGNLWTQHAKLIPSDGNPGDLFGSTVSIYDDHLLIGAVFNYESGYASGSVYYYHLENGSWLFVSKIKQPDPVTDARFGSSVSVHEETALIGCPYDDDNGYRSGSAYVFNLDDLMAVDPVEINESNYSVYPTITPGPVKLTRLSASENVTVDVIAMSGRTCHRYSIQEGTKELDIGLQGVGSGAFLIRVSKKNRTVWTSKVVVVD